MAIVARKLAKFVTALAVSALALGVSSVANAADDAKSIEAKSADYMRNIVPVYFPPVPFGWNIEIEDNVVRYINVANSKNKGQATTIKMRYTRKTSRMDASRYMDFYINNHSCTDKVEQGYGFYTTSCVTNNTYTIVIGEVNNMYIIELVGDYNAAARAIIENYVGSIIRGKRVFYDRSIGELHAMQNQ